MYLTAKRFVSNIDEGDLKQKLQSTVSLQI